MKNMPEKYIDPFPETIVSSTLFPGKEVTLTKMTKGGECVVYDAPSENSVFKMHPAFDGSREEAEIAAQRWTQYEVEHEAFFRGTPVEGIVLKTHTFVADLFNDERYYACQVQPKMEMRFSLFPSIYPPDDVRDSIEMISRKFRKPQIKEIVKQLKALHAVLWKLLFYKRIQLDFSPGNIFLSKEGKLVFIDAKSEPTRQHPAILLKNTLTYEKILPYIPVLAQALEASAAQRSEPGKIQDYLDDAGDYYLTSAYKRRVEELTELCGLIRAQVVAVDLDKTLISDPLAKSYDLFGRHRREITTRLSDTTLPLTERYLTLQRPLSKEMIDALQAEHKVKIWSVGGILWIQSNLEKMGIEIPEEDIIDLKKTQNSLLEPWSRYARLKKWIDRETRKLRPRRNQRLRWGHVDKGMIKIPSFLDVDLLFDDRAARQRDACKVAGVPDDGRKIIHVRPFIIKNDQDLRDFPRDRGLLDAVRKAVKMRK